tara:strand:- start:997 stop:1227 length:231 start_codon:yes stop_codon:yes gene_type:complete
MIGLNTLFLVAMIWDLIWRCFGVWKSTKNNQPIWSILFVLLQTMGILPILYIFIFSKMKKKTSAKKPERKTRGKKK